MNEQSLKILEELNQLANQTGIEVTELKHNQIGGKFHGYIVLEGIKNSFKVIVNVNLDFLSEIDGITLSVNPFKKRNSDIMQSIRESIEQMRNDFYTPMVDNWIELLSKEIKVRIELYN